MSVFEHIHLLMTGLGLGLIISAPVGPVNILCIQHSLARGFLAGFATGAGALLADFFIAAMAALGLTFVSFLVTDYQGVIECIGGLILLVFGWRLFSSHPKMLEPQDHSLSPYRHFGALPQSFLLTITNPGALLGIFAVVGSAGTAVGGLNSLNAALHLLAGLIMGGMIWWGALSWLISRLRSKITQQRLKLINRIAGSVLLISGAGLMARSFFVCLWGIS